MIQNRKNLAMRCVLVLASAVFLISTSATVFAANAEDRECTEESARPKLFSSSYLGSLFGKERIYSNAIFGSQMKLDVKPKEDLEKIAKMTSNPIGAAWMLWTQNDYFRVTGDIVDGDRYVNSTKFQPVMPFPIKLDGEDWNFLVRPVFQYQSVPLDKDAGKVIGLGGDTIQSDPSLSAIASDPWGRTSGFGDTVLLTLLGPNRLDGFIWGVGATQIFPTAAEDVLGQEKWQAGPALLLAKLAPKPGGFNVGALAQHWWSYAGDSDRESTNMTNIQYFINYRLSKTELVGMTPNITYDWNADDDADALTLPIGIGYSNTIKIGMLPVRFAIEYQYSLVKGQNISNDYNIRFMFIPVIPNPFRSY